MPPSGEPEDDATATIDIPTVTQTVAPTNDATDSFNETPTDEPVPTPTVDLSIIPETLVEDYLQYQNALATARSWFAARDDDLSGFFIRDDSSIVSEHCEIPPPTFTLFGAEYYRFWPRPYDNSKMVISPGLLVPVDTGDLLAFLKAYFYPSLDGDDWETHTLDATIDLADDWTANRPAINKTTRLSAQDAFDIYNAWLSEKSALHPFIADYALHEQPRGTYEILGERYYYFRSEEAQRYYFNVLVHMDTGELLCVEIEDGMWGGEHVSFLDTWLDYTSQYYD